MFFKKHILLISSLIFFLTTTSFADMLIAGGNAGDVLKSYDHGATWTKYYSGYPVQFSSVTQNNKQFVALGSMGNGVVLQSNDGRTWHVSDLPDFYPAQVIHTNNQYILIDGSLMQTSPDGKIWLNHIIPAPKNYPFLFLTSIAYGNGKYIAVGSAGAVATKNNSDAAGGCMVTSSDGIHWNVIVPTVMEYHSIIFANNQFIATGRNGAIATSNNGINWTQQSSGVADDLGRIVFANGEYVTFDVTQGVPSPAYVLTSPDAKNWTKFLIDTADQTVSLMDIISSDKQFILVGSSDAGGVVFVSTDATHWIEKFVGLKDKNGNPEALAAVG